MVPLQVQWSSLLRECVQHSINAWWRSRFIKDVQALLQQGTNEGMHYVHGKIKAHGYDGLGGPENDVTVHFTD